MKENSERIGNMVVSYSHSVLESTVYFLPLFYTPNPWIGELHDGSLVPLMVKVVTIPHRTSEDVLEVDSADVFSVSGQIPTKPKNIADIFNLLRVIKEALERRTGKSVESFGREITIYGGHKL
jgi:hypothetical protein